MFDQQLKDLVVGRVLPRVAMPAQYLGGELNIVRKDHRQMRGTLCLAFPDTYAIGMSHHGLAVLYALVNARDDWACERAFAPWPDMEAELRRRGAPLYGLETFTPLDEFDVVGFTLQYELGATNVLTMLDLGRIPLHGSERTMSDPLVIAGGPGAQNPEPMAPFIDLFVIGDGEPILPRLCDRWIELKENAAGSGTQDGASSRACRRQLLAELAREMPHCYVPGCYRAEYRDGRQLTPRPIQEGVPESIEPSVLSDLDGMPLPTAPIVPFVECVHDRIAIEIMRGCPWKCRFCQSTTMKRPLRFRRIETIVEAALATYRNTGYNEVSLLSLSSGDYPQFEQLVTRLKEVFSPLGVTVAVPSLRVNAQLRTMAGLIGNERRSALTLAPEAAREEMRHRIDKRISNDDLLEGCRQAFGLNYQSVKLYFMCGLPGEGTTDLDGIIEMAESISRLGKEVAGRKAKVTASVSNFVPKPHTPFQWQAMQSAEYFHAARERLRAQRRLRSVAIRCHGVDTSLLEGVICRGGRRVGDAIESAWRAGARMDGWSEQFQAARWWKALDEAGVDVNAVLHRPYDPGDPLPWDHIGVRQGRKYLETERDRAIT